MLTFVKIYTKVLKFLNVIAVIVVVRIYFWRCLMTDFKMNCSFSEISSYIKRKDQNISEQDLQGLDSIFNQCDEIDDRTKLKGKGGDGLLNNAEWKKFITLAGEKFTKLLADFKADADVEAYNKKQNEQKADKTRYEIPKHLELPPQVSTQVKRQKIASGVEGFSDKYNALVTKYAEKYKLDPNLVKAVIKKESRFDPNTVSKSGDNQGLMQVSKTYVKGNLFNPEKNISEGCRILRAAIDYFDGDVKKGLMGYNRGHSNATKALKNHRPENDAYVKIVTKYYEELTGEKLA